MNLLDRNSVLILPCLMFFGCHDSDTLDVQTKINERVDYLSFVDFADELVLSEGRFIDGVEYFNGKDSLLYLVFQEDKPLNGLHETFIELSSPSSVLLRITEKRDTVNNTLDQLRYLSNTLNVENLDGKTLVSFFYSKEPSVSGLDPVSIGLCSYFEGEKIVVEGHFPLHEDWTWSEYYTSNLNDTIKNLPLNVQVSLKDKWNSFVTKFQKNIYQG